MRIYSKFEEIQSFLSIPNEFFDLEDIINRYFFSAQDKITILDKILKFINLFDMFKTIKPFMKTVYNCIHQALEITTENINEYDELLLKTTLFKLLQEFVEYQQFFRKDFVLDYLTGSFEGLQLQPLIINLGLMVKPIYSDLSYVKKIEDLEQVEVSYVLGDNKEIEIKSRIDKWISRQRLDLNQQEELRFQLIREFENLIMEYSIEKETSQYQRLMNEVNEMLTLKFTLLSLMDSVNEDIAPIPIK